MSKQSRIESLAYQLWEARGSPHGSADDDWQAAVERLSGDTGDSSLVDESSKESFPASDAPASHLPDDPPANAEEKWAASRMPSRE